MDTVIEVMQWIGLGAIFLAIGFIAGLIIGCIIQPIVNLILFILAVSHSHTHLPFVKTIIIGGVCGGALGLITFFVLLIRMHL